MLAVDFFMRKPRSAKITIPYNSFVKTNIEESTIIDGSLYFDEYGSLLTPDTEIDNFKEKTELITGLSEIFLKIYELKNSTYEQMFTGIIDVYNSSFGDGGNTATITAYDPLKIVNEIAKKINFIPNINYNNEYITTSPQDIYTSIKKIITNYLNINIDFDVNGFTSSIEKSHLNNTNYSSSFLKNAYDFDVASSLTDELFTDDGTIDDPNYPVKTFSDMFRDSWSPYDAYEESTHLVDSGNYLRVSNVQDFLDKYVYPIGDISSGLNFYKNLIVGNGDLSNPSNHGVLHPDSTSHEQVIFFAPIFNKQLEPNDPFNNLPHMRYVYTTLFSTKRGQLGETINNEFMRCIPGFVISLSKNQEWADSITYRLRFRVGYIWLDNSTSDNTVVYTKVDSDANSWSGLGTYFYFDKNTEEFTFMTTPDEQDFSDSRGVLEKIFSRSFFPEKDVGTRIRNDDKLFVSYSDRNGSKSIIEEYSEPITYNCFYDKRRYSNLIRFISFIGKEKPFCNQEGTFITTPINTSGTPIFTLTKYSKYSSTKKRNTASENIEALDPYYIDTSSASTAAEVDEIISEWNNSIRQPLLEEYRLIFGGEFSRETTVSFLNREGHDLSLIALGEIIELDFYTGMFKDIHINGKLYIMEYDIQDKITITGLFKPY
ncbi:MAG: hypothetical protein OMM_00957 [Candidatus Magnetoglobus multicellularis str. Araruama]|uniref:Uncharacterized protein n=1 Tax=Candidatus Magnetoglobus multicellularis str. Araruama TaxID=890399 RepID=A0A1V1PF72_9BACT|nr:MAG: hypothetical protein OMM_00957 [Candidatus Magnetoglobus multicellularis str. Araruama]